MPLVRDRARALLARPGVLPASVLAGVALCAPSLSNGFCWDDHWLRLVGRHAPLLPGLPLAPWDQFAFWRGDSATFLARRELGGVPWWTDEALRAVLLRPIASLTHALDQALWPESAVAMHAHSLVWFALLVVAAGWLYRQLMPAPWVAGLATVLFAIDDGHGMPVGWIANRSAVISAVFAAVALGAHHRWRASGWRPGVLLAPLAWVGALLCGEIAVGLGAFLLAYALCLDRARPLARAVSLLPCGVAYAAWHLSYRALGFGVAGLELYIDPAASPVRFARLALERVPVMLCSQLAVPSAGLFGMVTAQAARLWVGAAVVICALVALALAALLARDRLARFFGLATLLSIVPACGTAPHDRLLMIASIGGAGLVAVSLAAVAEGASAAWPAAARRALGTLAVVWLLVHGLHAPLSLPLQAVGMGLLGRATDRAMNAIPRDIGTRTLMVVNAPFDLLCSQIPWWSLSVGREAPARLRCLGTSEHAVRVSRPSERELYLRVQEGYFDGRLDGLFRSLDRPLRAGDSVGLSDMTVEVLELTPDARPRQVRVRLHPHVDPGARVWMTWQGKGWVPFELPGVGESRVLAPARLLDMLL
jgi:hypothetical protein